MVERWHGGVYVREGGRERERETEVGREDYPYEVFMLGPFLSRLHLGLLPFLFYPSSNSLPSI